MRKKIIATMMATMLALSVNSMTVFACQCSNVNLSQQNGMLRITEGGKYILQGKLAGSVYVDAGNSDVELVLDGVDIDGKDSPGIMAVNGKNLRITLPEGSVNRVVDGSSNDQYNAAIYSMMNTMFQGNGSLYVTGNNKNGINVNNANLTFNGGNYAVKANSSGIMGNNLVLNDGHFSMQASQAMNPMNNFRNNGAMIEEISRTGNMFTSGNKNNAFGQHTVSDNTNGNNQQNTEPFSMFGNIFGQNQSLNGNTQSQTFSNTSQSQTNPGSWPFGQNTQLGNQMMQPENMVSTLESSDSPTEVVSGTMTNGAALLEADYENATYITVTDDESDVEIKSSGTYVVTGSSSDGNITVKKGTEGVVLVLDDLDLTSTTGATVSINKEAEVKVIISGNVTLTDNENPDDENSTDEAIADAFDGAALKAKAGSQVYVTGDGTLTINGNAKNGIKGGDDSSLIFDGVTMNITATNDGINSNYDVTLLSGDYTIAAEDDAIHADHILTIGDTDGTGPDIDITKSNEGLEGTVINMYGGDVDVTSIDDAVNAANGDGVYEGELDYSFNMMGGDLTINSQGDGIDSNGNINLIDGNATITSTYNGGEAGMDYDGQIYISNDFNLNNNSGIAGPDGMGGPGGMNGQMGDQFGQMPGQQFAQHFQ